MKLILHILLFSCCHAINPELLDTITIPSSYKGNFRDLFQTRQFKRKALYNNDHDAAPIPYIKAHSHYICGDRFSSSSLGVTLVTQVSLNHLNLLLDIAASFPGTISAAVYIDAFSDLDLLPQIISNFKSRMSFRPYKYAKVVLSLLFGLEFLKPDFYVNSYDYLYPINALRNLAIENAETRLIYFLDADFIPSNNTFKYLSKNYRRMLKISKTNTIFVVPAFEAAKHVEFTIPIDRSQLLASCKALDSIPYQSSFNLKRREMAPKKVRSWCLGKMEHYHINIAESQVQCSNLVVDKLYKMVLFNAHVLCQGKNGNTRRKL